MTQFKFEGTYSYKVIKADGSPTGKEGVFKNSILNNFFNMLQTDLAIVGGACKVHIGTGTSPTNLDWTTLEEPLTSVNASITNPNAVLLNSDTVLQVKRVHKGTFGVGEIIGEITEIGVSLNGGSTVHTRALFRDSAGNPTRVSILGDEALVVEYVLTCTFSAETSVYTTDITTDKGVTTTHTITVQPMALNNMTAYFGSNNAVFRSNNGSYENRFLTPVGGGTKSVALALQSTTIGKRRYKMSATAADFSWAEGVGILEVAGFKYKIEPPIVKDADNSLTFYFDQTVSRA